MAKKKPDEPKQETAAMNEAEEVPLNHVPLWELNLQEIEGKNIESAGRETVNGMLKKGWIILHIYTLKYREGSTWRERPMAILGKPR